MLTPVIQETFPRNWYRRPTAFEFSEFLVDINTLYAGSPVELGGTEGLNNFVPLSINPSTMTPSQLACFITRECPRHGTGLGRARHRQQLRTIPRLPQWRRCATLRKLQLRPRELYRA